MVYKVRVLFGSDGREDFGGARLSSYDVGRGRLGLGRWVWILRGDFRAELRARPFQERHESRFGRGSVFLARQRKFREVR